jgi:thioredoxin reductase (NADPH)
MDISPDVIVIGAGPAGLTAAIYARRAGLATTVLEKFVPGGQAALTDAIENYPGFEEPVQGLKLTEAMRKQAESFGATFQTGEVQGLAPAPFDDAAHAVRLKDGETGGRTVVIASGARHRRLGIPGEDRLWGKGISCCAQCDGMFYRGKRVVVVGGGDTAIKESIFLTRFAHEITVVHRRDRLRATQALQDKLFTFKDQVRVAWNTVVEEIFGEDGVTGVRVRNVRTGAEDTLECDGVFIYVGFRPNTEPFAETVETDAKGYIVTDETMATSVPGVFAAGDCRQKYLRQIVTACADGATAAFAAEQYLAKQEIEADEAGPRG